MKLFAAVVVSLMCVTQVLFSDSITPEKPAHAGFEKMKSLVGTWKGKTKDGMDVTVTCRLVSAGQAVEEHLSVADMVTMFHADGDAVMLTHYCAGNNQPRMRASFKPGDTTMSFAFVDVTNLPNPNADHMHDAKFTFVDADHMTAEWTSYTGGQPAGVIAFELARAK
jgi:hypothetical protein